ncbi:hypothetical protein Bca52824_049360 [Brassica carinata]|uniref:Uncharacterized protein n=1 Tax=Brassica carinata TaxID=52824 RepID=A0A8X7UU29_BRACI|nr:hypothetical protein Bca52824_049360 [Brassica carinata]
MVDLVQTQVVDEVSQLQTEDDADGFDQLVRFQSTKSLNPRFQRRRDACSLKDKDDRISLLETRMAAQQAGYEALRRLNQQMMEMMRGCTNEVFPDAAL